MRKKGGKCVTISLMVMVLRSARARRSSVDAVRYSCPVRSWYWIEKTSNRARISLLVGLFFLCNWSEVFFLDFDGEIAEVFFLEILSVVLTGGLMLGALRVYMFFLLSSPVCDQSINPLRLSDARMFRTCRSVSPVSSARVWSLTYMLPSP